ncbi:MAG: small subunit ribosomal protein [Baekduia sp.]|jgi:small subunit ribosomal protein S17|nr:rpsQ [Conexibacter sp.]MDX6716286.1 small subunit ribosomal protein [Baekduia sp.]MDX6733141.1 small subunit ribosomal protein [Baekduia sp.]
MADETPDTTEEQVPATADAVAAETAEETTAAPEAQAAEQAPAEPVTPLTPKERKVASRARRGNRRGATPEERAETRKAKAAARTRYRTKRREKDRAAKTEAGTLGPAQTPRSTDHGPGAPKERLGIVVSDKADKTITVRIDVARRHRRYQKIVRSSTTLHAHDESNDANAGDRVRLIESRPLSATKRWRLVEVLERAK